jgi:HK97 family phage prohead protease
MPPTPNASHETRQIEFQPVLESRELEGKSVQTLRGYAAKFNVRSELIWGLFREEIAPGAFSDSLGEDIRALMNHNTGIVLGRTRANTLRLFEDGVGLGFELDLPDTTAGRDLAESIRRGDISQMSFGFETLSDEWRLEDKTEVRTLKKVRLFEISPVAFPAYPQTEVAMRSLEAWRAIGPSEDVPAPKASDEGWRSRARDRDLKLRLAEMA